MEHVKPLVLYIRRLSGDKHAMSFHLEKKALIHRLSLAWQLEIVESAS